MNWFWCKMWYLERLCLPRSLNNPNDGEVGGKIGTRHHIAGELVSASLPVRTVAWLAARGDQGVIGGLLTQSNLPPTTLLPYNSPANSHRRHCPIQLAPSMRNFFQPVYSFMSLWMGFTIATFFPTLSFCELSSTTVHTLLQLTHKYRRQNLLGKS